MATTEQLKTAFMRSRLWALGWTFERAMACDLTRRGLECSARAALRHAAKQGKPAPLQLVLI